MSTLEIKKWDGPTADGDVVIIDAHFRQNVDHGYHDGQRTRWGSGPDILLYRFHDISDRKPDLSVRLFHYQSEAVYRLDFDQTVCHRAMTEIEMSELEHVPHACFFARGHKWTTEAKIAAEMAGLDGWSFVIMTQWDCMEILAAKPPVVTLERYVEPQVSPMKAQISGVHRGKGFEGED